MGRASRRKKLKKEMTFKGCMILDDVKPPVHKNDLKKLRAWFDKISKRRTINE